jgi:hypothetical protein
MLFDYQATKTFANTLQVDDIGNCAIRCLGRYKDGKVYFPGEFYLITRTIMGRTYLAKYGPMVPDIPYMPNTFDASFKIFAYKEATICREIQLFLNDTTHDITEAEEITDIEVFENFPSLEETFSNL